MRNACRCTYVEWHILHGVNGRADRDYACCTRRDGEGMGEKINTLSGTIAARVSQSTRPLRHKFRGFNKDSWLPLAAAVYGSARSGRRASGRRLLRRSFRSHRRRNFLTEFMPNALRARSSRRGDPRSENRCPESQKLFERKGNLRRAAGTCGKRVCDGRAIFSSGQDANDVRRLASRTWVTSHTTELAKGSFRGVYNLLFREHRSYAIKTN